MGAAAVVWPGVTKTKPQVPVAPVLPCVAVFVLVLIRLEFFRDFFMPVPVHYSVNTLHEHESLTPLLCTMAFESMGFVTDISVVLARIDVRARFIVPDSSCTCQIH